MRILVTTDYLDAENHGGAGRVVLELGRALIERGHTVAIIAGAPAVRQGLLEYRGAWFEYATFPYRGGKNRGVLFFLRALRIARRVARSFGFAPELVIHCQPLSALLFRTRRVPAVYLFTSSWVLEYLAERCGSTDIEDARRRGGTVRLGTRLRRFAEARAVTRAAHVVALSECTKRDLVEMHALPPERASILPASADLDRFHPLAPEARAALRERLGVPAEAFLCACVRRLVPRTGVDLLVQAFTTVLREAPAARLWIAGRGPLEEELRARIDALGLSPAVRMLGYVPDDALADLYRAADLAIVPTRLLEGFGLATIEALACGTPVVATPVGGSVEILRRFEPALLAADVTSDALAAAILAWERDRARLSTLRPACRAYVEGNYSWRRFAAGVESILEDAVASRG